MVSAGCVASLQFAGAGIVPGPSLFWSAAAVLSIPCPGANNMIARVAIAIVLASLMLVIIIILPFFLGQLL